jgi:glycosyltransferase involved in cell wall biosynthesis
MKSKFIVANIIRSPSDPHASALCKYDMLKKYFCGTRKFTKGIEQTKQSLHPIYGLLNYIGFKTLGLYRGECNRLALCPSFERRVIRSIREGDNLLGGIGYLNDCIEKIHENGGSAILDARNSHPSSFWTIVAEEYAHWGVKTPPIYPAHHMRQQRSVALADYFFVPSMFVKNSFLAAGIPEEKLLYLPYPVDLSTFTPPCNIRPPNRPLTISSAGGASLRKGTPYLLEAFSLIKKKIPSARLKFVGKLGPQIAPIASRLGYEKLPIEFTSRMKHPDLVRWLHESDIYVLPSIEEGMVRSVAEAMACGLPVVTTANSGTNDFITDGVNGSIVPIRDPQSIADAVLSWWERIQSGQYIHAEAIINHESLGYSSFETRFFKHLNQTGFHTGRP